MLFSGKISAMPEDGRYAREARPESWQWLTRTLEARREVISIAREGRFLLAVSRRSLSPLTLYVCNLYEVGVADVEEILREEPTIDAIVTMSLWNRYSPQAKELASQRSVGLFKPREFFGALGKEGRDFIEHLSAEQREELRRKRGSY
jgi:hypothetical protein